LVNENGAAYRFDYDPLDRLKREQGLDGLVTDYRYDPVGNVIEKREHTDGAALRRTRYERDAAGRLLEKHIAQGDAHSRTRYTYDPIGRLIQARNADSRIDLGYDPLGRILEEITTSPAGEQRIAHGYDPLGNRTRTELPDGRSLHWLYYGSGHLHQIHLDGEVLCDYERDALHREVSRTQGALQSHTGYDPLGRIRRQLIEPRAVEELGAGAGASAGSGDADPDIGFTLAFNPKQLHLQRRYAYDPAGELTAIDDTRHGNSRYGYDALGRIVHSRLPNLEETFAFDPAHNLLPVTGDGTESGNSQGYIKDNRLRVYQDKRYDYDHFGNLTEKRIGSHTRMQFQYDLEHQLTEAEVTRNGVTQTYRYAYDPFGRRIAKQDAFATTAFLWDGNRLLVETRGSQTKTYVYEQQGFVPVAQLDNEQVRYYHTDHLGTPRELTDTEGEIVWEEVYATWGNTLKKVWQARPAEPTQRLDTQPLRFQGQYFDAETGLHYNRFRYYDPDVGRFVSQDPIGLLGGDNLYQYAANPGGWVDPLGLSSESCNCSPTPCNCEAGQTPAQRLADRAQGLPSAQRPNTVAVITHSNGTMTVGRNQGGVVNAVVQGALERAPQNCFDGQCAEINALSRALNEGRSLDGATVSVANVRGAGSTSGIHGTPKTPCSACESVLQQLGVDVQS
jgi:RHS repeat-associated protein